MPNVLCERLDDAVALVTLNRPEKLNSLTPDDANEARDRLDGLAQDASCRAVILTGAGRGFCSGLDVTALAANVDSWTVPQTMEWAKPIINLVTRIRTLPQPVIAAVNGPCTGAGLGLALACDTRVAAASARFSAAFVRLGVSGCDMGVSYLLPKIAGPTLAFEMMLTGRVVAADEAEQHRMVLRVVPDGEVVTDALEIAKRICSNSPFGVTMTKEVMHTNLDAPSLQAAIELENRTQGLCVQTRDQREAVAAFMEQREPVFTNS